MANTGAEWSSEITTRSPLSSRVSVNSTVGGVSAASGAPAATTVTSTPRRMARIVIPNSSPDARSVEQAGRSRSQTTEYRIQRADDSTGRGGGSEEHTPELQSRL